MQSETLDSSMDHSNMSAMSHDAEDDKSLVLQYEGRQLHHSVTFFTLCRFSAASHCSHWRYVTLFVAAENM